MHTINPTNQLLTADIERGPFHFLSFFIGFGYREGGKGNIMAVTIQALLFHIIMQQQAYRDRSPKNKCNTSPT